MAAIDEIHEVQGHVATIQSHLAGAEEVLEVAEEVALAGRAVKRGFRRLIFAPVVILGAVALVIIWRKFKTRVGHSVAAAEATPQST